MFECENCDKVDDDGGHLTDKEKFIGQKICRYCFSTQEVDVVDYDRKEVLKNLWEKVMGDNDYLL